MPGHVQYSVNHSRCLEYGGASAVSTADPVLCEAGDQLSIQVPLHTAGPDTPQHCWALPGGSSQVPRPFPL